MIERYVDTAIANLLRTISGLQVYEGLQDNEPPLETPYCAVFSNVTEISGRLPVYGLLTTIEYVTVSGQDVATNVIDVMTQIDNLIGPGADYSGTIQTPGLSGCRWQAIGRSEQQVGDRRIIIRELTVKATMTPQTQTV